MNTRLLILLLLFLISKNSLSQDLPNIVPPSPEAASLAKFTETPVSLYTGLPNINIPFYNIDLQGKNIPIGVSYHARGLKVEEIASRVGIGWSLNFGGAITRQARGIADDANNGYLSSTFYSSFHTNESTRISTYNANNSSILDYEPDMFIFNFLGYSGKFIFDQATDKPVLQKFDDITIEATILNGKIDKWTVTDSKGFKYCFGELTSLSRDKETVLNSYVESQGVLTSLTNNSTTHYNTWNLMQILAPNGDTVTYTYEYEEPIYFRRSYDKLIGSNVNTYFSRIKMKQNHVKEIIFKEGKIVFDKEITEREDLDNAYALKTIKIYDTDNTIIKKFNLDYSYFNAVNDNNQLAYLKTNEPHASKRLRLDSIEEEGSNSGVNPPYVFTYHSQLIPNRFSNSQDNWGYYNGKNNGDRLTFFDYGNVVVNRQVDTLKSMAGMLKKITYPTGGSVNFEYEHNKAIPPAYMGDLYFNPNNPSETKNVGLLKGAIFYAGKGTYETTIFSIVNQTYGLMSSNINFTGSYGTCSETTQLSTCDYQVSIVGVNGTSYSAILYMGQHTFTIPPAGDYKLRVRQIRNHDPNDYVNAFSASLSWEEMTDNDLDLLYASGKRIKQITHKDADDTVIKTMSYEYKDTQGKSSGRIFSLPNFYYIQTYYNGTPVFDHYGSRPGSPLTSLQGNSIGYSEVTEYIGGDTLNQGKTVHEFTVTYDDGEFYKWPYHLPVDNEWLRGKPLLSRYYKNNGNNSYTLIKSDEYIYTYANGIAPAVITNPLLPPNTDHVFLNTRAQYNLPLIKFVADGDSNNSNNHNSYKIYNFNGGAFDIKTTKETTFHNTLEPVKETTYSYNYDKHYQQAGSITKTSDSKPIITKTFYPEDVTSTSALGGDNLTTAEKAAIDKLKAPSPTNVKGQHRLSEPIQTETYKDDDADGIADSAELLSRQRTNYREWNPNQVLPEYVQTSKGTNNLSDRIQFVSYYDNDNVKEVKKTDGTTIVYIWGYEKQYPIAKIENATYSEVSSQVSNLQSKSDLDFDNCLDSGSCAEKNLRTALTALRNSVPNAMVTTYTYDPLIGVTSVTDPKGYTRYYEYDEFGRLERIRDKTGYILSENQYNYALQTNNN